MNARVRIIVPAALVSLLALTAVPAAGSESDRGGSQLSKINHIVVIYEENHSFDNLYGNWPGVNGRANADAAQTLQVKENGTTYTCLLQNDVNLTSPTPLRTTCTDTTGTLPPASSTPFSSHFTNAPFRIDEYITPSDTTCPAPGAFYPNGVAKGSGLPGGCTRDIVHRYYQEQYQLNGGKQNLYVTGSDAAGLAMGVYDTKALPIYKYLHQEDHPNYAIADNFFQAAFGGSFLNHQWLVAAATPIWMGPDGSGAINDGSPSDLHSVVDANGMPNNYALYKSPLGPNSTPPGPKDQALTASCTPGPGRSPTPAGVVCGDYAVNTIQPLNQPYAPGTKIGVRLPLQTAPTIGDRLSANGVDWAWYSGGWDNAAGNTTSPWYTNGPGPTCADPHHYSIPVEATYPYCPDQLFQFHHQALNYFASYAPGTTARAQHLRDEGEFVQLANSSTNRQCNLKPVSFVKPIGADNEHPGYTNETSGSQHLVNLIKAIESSACKKDTMVIATYDEFGGQWDHVTPPGQGGASGPHDVWGPGTRIPALVIAPHLQGEFVVDRAQHDTTSILATIEHRFGLAPLSSRDAAVKDLSTVFRARGGGEGGGDGGDGGGGGGGGE
jgi:acid phosphatase